MIIPMRINSPPLLSYNLLVVDSSPFLLFFHSAGSGVESFNQEIVKPVFFHLLQGNEVSKVV